jgi:hypothetical protein
MNQENKENASIGILRDLAELPPATIISEEALAKVFSRHKVSIKRAVERNELPPSIRLFGEPVWTAGVIIAHLEKRLAEAAEEYTKTQKRLGTFST